MPITTLEPTSSQRRLRTFSAIAAILAIVQLVVAITMIATHNATIQFVHEALGYLYAAAALITLVPAWIWGRLSRDNGLIGHAAGMAVLGIIQLVIGLTYVPKSAASWLIYVHMGLGLLIVLGAAALYVRSGKRSVIVTDVDAAGH